MPLVDLTPPVVEPVDLVQAKTYLKIDTNDDDQLLQTLISMVRQQVEISIGRTLIRRTMIYRCPPPKDRQIYLPRPPLLSVNRLSLIGENDQAVDIPASQYRVLTKTEPGVVSLLAGKRWRDYQSVFSTVEIDFTAGYGDSPGTVPLPLRQAILLGLARAYEFRAVSPDDSLPSMSEALIRSYRMVRI